MSIVERQIAETLGQFLADRRIACDHGLLEVRKVVGGIMTTLNGENYEIVISVTRLIV